MKNFKDEEDLFVLIWSAFQNILKQKNVKRTKLPIVCDMLYMKGI